jgi:hypothetical protein
MCCKIKTSAALDQCFETVSESKERRRNEISSNICGTEAVTYQE